MRNYITRKYDRVELLGKVFCKLGSKKDIFLEGRILNISSGGTKIETTRSFSYGSKIEIIIFLPYNNTINFKAIVRHCQLNYNLLYNIGLEFINLNNKVKKDLQDFTTNNLKRT